MVNPILFQSGLPNIVGGLQSAGFYTYLFPFLLSLAILYSIINFAFDKRIPKAANGLISIIMSFFVMLYTASNTGITSFFTNLGGQFLIIGSGILFLIVILGLVGFKFEKLTEEHKNFKWAVVLFLILIGFILFTGAGGMRFLNIQGFAASSDFWTMVFFVVIVAIVFMFLTNEGDGGGKKEEKKNV